jgi:hypothetical protein
MLSRLLEHGQNNENREWTDRIKHSSPVAWRHIIFYGRYEFGKQSETIDMAKIVQELAQRFSK